MERHWLRWRPRRYWTHRSRKLKTYSPKLTPRRTSTEFQKDYGSGRLDNWQHTARGEHEALKDKVAKRLAVVKLKTFFSLLSKIKAEARIDTLANRLTDVEIKMSIKTANETLGEISTDLGRDTW